MARWLSLLAAASAAVLALCGAARAEDVDLALVLAVDVSGSVDNQRFAVQRDGYAAAFTNPAVLEAIASGRHGAVLVTFVEWAGRDHQQQMVGWAVIRDAQSSAEFGRAVAASRRAFSDWTSISGAIDFSVDLLRDSGAAPDRRVIDVSGDGPNNNGRPASEARDAAVAAGITINGLPIVATEPNLDAYYRDNVIGGDDAFTVVAADFDSFAEGILKKLVREIAALPRAGRRLAAAPSGLPR
jgi:hypothetical protein